MYSLRLTAEQIEIRDTVRDFVAREIKPVALNPERLQQADPRFPPAVLALASQMGLRTLALPEPLGGAGADCLTCCIVAEELAAGDVGAATTLAQTSMLGRTLFEAMNEEQRARFLPQFVTDDSWHLAHARSDADDDSALTFHELPVSALAAPVNASRATDGDWILNGEHPFVANAPIAKLIAVDALAAAVGGSASRTRTWLLTPDMPGLTVREHAGEDTAPDGEPLYRWHHGQGGALVFTDCRMPAANLLSGDTNPPAERNQGRGNPLVQALNLGVGRAAYEAALDYAKLRIQGGRPIVEHQSIATLLAEIVIKLEAVRNAVWHAAWAADHPDAYADSSLAALPLQTIARVFAAETIHQVALDAAEVFGAMGVMRDMPMQKYVHDAMVFLHAGTGNSVAKLRIAESVAGYRPAVPARREAAA